MRRRLTRSLVRLGTAGLVAACAIAIGAVLGTARNGAAAGSAAPTDSSAPTISGTPQDSETLTADHGDWNGSTPITYSYQWRRCDSNGNNCNDISGADAQSYKVTSHDVGHTLRVRVTAKNADGSASASSVPTAVVLAAANKPSEQSPPTISGTSQVGASLTADAGKWTGSTPITYSYEWRRCDANGGSCAAISGANGRLYNVATQDVGHTLRVHVTAENSAGSASDTSAPSAVVTGAPAPPAPTGCPSGKGAVNVTDLSAPARLSVDGFQSSPARLGRDTQDVSVRIHVSACGSRPVSGALVYLTAVPYAQFSIPTEQATGGDGWVTEVIHRGANYPASVHQQLLAVFVRARKPGENLLAGISTRRLISFPVNLSQ
jgi:hypothetical protein